MELKAIACDIDQTLTDNHSLLNLKAVELVRNLEAAGIKVVLISSREFMSAGSLAAFIGACGIVAAEDGSVVGDYLHFRQPKLLGDPKKIIHGIQALRQFIKPQLRVLPSWPGRVCSSILLHTDGYPFTKANEILAQQSTGTRLIDSGIAYLLIDAATGKGRGLCEVAAILDLKPEQFMAIGDNFNDLDMFEVAGWSAAVGNAPQAVKDQVDYVSEATYGEGFCEGVLQALSQFRPDFKMTT
jgi:phosphoglycolate phosphatase (TIGR01487 family)